MLWINWIPELVIIVLLLVSLLILSTKRVATIVFPLAVAASSAITLVYFWIREEGFSFTSPYQAFVLDSLSYYGRSMGLLWLVLGGVAIAFHSGLTLKNKMKVTALMIFFSAFLSSLFLAKPILMFTLSWVGGLMCLITMMMIESQEKGLRSSLLRQFSLLLLVVGMLSALMSFFPESKELAILLGLVISFGFPLSLIQVQSFLAKAALAQSWFVLWVFFAGGVFWLRFGLPLVGTNTEMMGLVFSLTALHSVWIAIRTKEASVWLGAVLFAVVHFSWLGLLLESKQAMSLFYGFGLSALPLFTFSGFAFHQAAPALKKAKIIVSLGLVALLPAVTADLHFLLLRSLIEKGFLSFALVGVAVWFMLCVSVIQQLGQLITQKKSQEVDTLSNSILLVAFLSVVIGLTFLKDPLLQLLNHHASS